MGASINRSLSIAVVPTIKSAKCGHIHIAEPVRLEFCPWAACTMRHNAMTDRMR